MIKNKIYILGISAFYHDSAACLLSDGEIIAAAQEERFTRKKHDKNFPSNAIMYCLKEASISADKISFIVFYEQPILKFDRLFKTYLSYAPRGFKTFTKATQAWLSGKLNHKKIISDALNNITNLNINWDKRIKFSEHHFSHAASAFFPSPFKNSAILTLDGVGEWATASVSIGNGKNLRIVKELNFPHSLGLLYSAFTYYTGFKVNSGEYKVMGLASYGKPKYVDLINNNLLIFNSDGSFKLNMNYFSFPIENKMINKNFENLFGGPARAPETKISQREMDIAASIQKVTEDIVIKIAKNISEETGEKNLCLAGGVALNCVANGILLKTKIFDNIWIQPAAGDAGGALGAALAFWFSNCKSERVSNTNQDKMKGSYLGPKFTNKDIEEELKDNDAVFYKLKEKDLIERVATELINQKAIGWMQGRMEFGPRALGARSIIADPRSPKMQKQLNLKVKYRESFRPFAPSILRENVDEWFELNQDSPYMLLVSNILKNKRSELSDKERNLFGIDLLNVSRSLIPAVTHVDYSARIQTVHKDTNPKYYALISKFKEKTNCPILINTSFNIRGEPIVCTPTDAYKCFMGTELDILVIGDYILLKNEQKINSKINYQDKYEFD